MVTSAVISVIGKLCVLGNLDLFQTVQTCEDPQKGNNCRSLYCKGIFLWTWKNCCVCVLMYFEFSYNDILIGHCSQDQVLWSWTRCIFPMSFFLFFLPPTSPVVYVEYSAGMLNFEALTASDFRKGFEYSLIKSWLTWLASVFPFHFQEVVDKAKSVVVDKPCLHISSRNLILLSK